MKIFLLKKIAVYNIVFFLLISSILTAVITYFVIKKPNVETEQAANPVNSCDYNVKRLSGYNFVKPLIFVDDEFEGARLSMVKSDVNSIIENYKANQGVASVSVYLRDFNSNEWVSINEELKYEPGSLFKVPILIAYLKLSEEKRGLLDQELLFETPFAIHKNVAFQSKQIQLGHRYSIRELLHYMIAYSDNNATALLNNNLKPEVLSKLFADLNLEIPDVKAQNYYITVKDYSLFMRALYNASYLSKDNSEYAAELLSKCDFNEGIINGLPQGTLVAHKFGESGTTNDMQLHESAIVYSNSKPYLLTIMTKGKDNVTLCKLISEISATVFRFELI